MTYSWLITGSVSREIRWVPLVEQALLTLSEHMSSSPVLSGVRVSRYLLFCVLFWRLVFVLFRLAIVLPVRLRLMDSGYPFDIFKFFVLFVNIISVMNISEMLLPYNKTKINQWSISGSNMREKMEKFLIVCLFSQLSYNFQNILLFLLFM